MAKLAPSRSGVAQPLARVTAQKRSYALAGVDVPVDGLRRLVFVSCDPVSGLAERTELAGSAHPELIEQGATDHWVVDVVS
jgi:hypothetical protein